MTLFEILDAWNGDNLIRFVSSRGVDGWKRSHGCSYAAARREMVEMGEVMGFDSDEFVAYRHRHFPSRLYAGPARDYVAFVEGKF